MPWARSFLLLNTNVDDAAQPLCPRPKEPDAFLLEIRHTRLLSNQIELSPLFATSLRIQCTSKLPLWSAQSPGPFFLLHLRPKPPPRSSLHGHVIPVSGTRSSRLFSVPLQLLQLMRSLFLLGRGQDRRNEAVELRASAGNTAFVASNLGYFPEPCSVSTVLLNIPRTSLHLSFALYRAQVAGR